MRPLQVMGFLVFRKSSVGAFWALMLRMVFCLMAAGASSSEPFSETPGRTYFVDSEIGDDANDGLSVARPFRTLRHSADRLNRTGGDTLVLRGVFRETLNVTRINHGGDVPPNPARPTVIRCAMDPGRVRQRAVIDGGLSGADSFPFDCRGKEPGLGPNTDNRYLHRGIVISECNYITVVGLEVRGIAGLGVLAWRSSHVLLTNLTVEWTSQSAMTLSHGQFNDPPVRDLVVSNCRINQSNLGFWRDRDNPLPDRRGYEMRSETLSIINCDDFKVEHNHLSNSLMEGIDFKMGARNGLIQYNLVEQCRSAGIYANEGRDTRIRRNVVRRIGYYDPQDGTGLQIAAPYLNRRLPFVKAQESGAVGILISNGDLNGPGRPNLETGRTSGIAVVENLVSWTRMNSICAWNEWRKEGRNGWRLDDIQIENNVSFKACQGGNPIIGAIQMDAAATGIKIRNNIIASSGRDGLKIFDDPAWPRPAAWPRRIISHNLLHENAHTSFRGDAVILDSPGFLRIPETPVAEGDFHLGTGSPARKAGETLQDSTSANIATDIGAYPDGVGEWKAGLLREMDP